MYNWNFFERICSRSHILSFTNIKKKNWNNSADVVRALYFWGKQIPGTNYRINLCSVSILRFLEFSVTMRDFIFKRPSKFVAFDYKNLRKLNTLNVLNLECKDLHIVLNQVKPFYLIKSNQILLCLYSYEIHVANNIAREIIYCN